jgi:hypothetical protein
MIPKDCQTWNLSTWRIQPFAKNGLTDFFLTLCLSVLKFDQLAAASFIPLALDLLILPRLWLLHPGFRLCPSFFAAARCWSYSVSSRFVPIRFASVHTLYTLLFVQTWPYIRQSAPPNEAIIA